MTEEFDVGPEFIRRQRAEERSGGARLTSGLASTATKITYGSSVIWWHLMAGEKQPRQGDFASGKYTTLRPTGMNLR